VEIGQIAIREISNEPRHDIYRVAVALPHFQFVPIDQFPLTHHFEHSAPSCRCARNEKKFALSTSSAEIEAENADDRGIAGHRSGRPCA